MNSLKKYLHSNKCNKWTIRKGWALKNWCFWTVMLGKTLYSPLDSKEIKPVNLKGDHSWIFIGGTDAEAEAPILWPPDPKNWLTGKDLMLGKIEGRRRRGWQDKMVGWHHQLNGHEFGHGQATGDGEGQGSLVCCSPWGCKDLDTTERLNNNNKMNDLVLCFIIFKVKSILRPYYINLFFILVFLYRFYFEARILLSLLSMSMIDAVWFYSACDGLKWVLES